MQFDKELQGIRTVAIAGHIRPDGDSVGACIGLWHYIRDNFPQIQADMWLEKPDEKFSVLPDMKESVRQERKRKHMICSWRWTVRHMTVSEMRQHILTVPERPSAWTIISVMKAMPG